MGGATLPAAYLGGNLHFDLKRHPRIQGSKPRKLHTGNDHCVLAGSLIRRSVDHISADARKGADTEATYTTAAPSFRYRSTASWPTLMVARPKDLYHP